MRAVLLICLFVSCNAFSCVVLDIDAVWNSSDKVYLGRVTSGKLVSKNGYEYAKYRVKVTHKLKGNKIRSLETATVDSHFPMLAIGNSYLIFQQYSGRVDYCGQTQEFYLEWLEEGYSLGDEPREVISKVKRELLKRP